jgi:hypothetical protein
VLSVNAECTNQRVCVCTRAAYAKASVRVGRLSDGATDCDVDGWVNHGLECVCREGSVGGEVHTELLCVCTTHSRLALPTRHLCLTRLWGRVACCVRPHNAQPRAGLVISRDVVTRARVCGIT